MTVVMLVASSLCFLSSFAYNKSEKDEEIAEKLRAHQSYNHIFGDDQIVSGANVAIELQPYNGIN